MKVMRIHRKFRLPALVGLLAFSSVVNAFECGTPSPRLQAMGAAYFELPRTVDSKGRTIKPESINVSSNKLLKALERGRFRRGSGTRHECPTKESDKTISVSKFRLRNISIDHHDENFVLSALEEDRDSRITRTKELLVPLLDNEISLINKNEVSANRRSRNPYGLRSTHFHEIEVKAVKSKSVVTVTQTTWINGEISDATVWTLEP